eukprot:3025626-Lingulodinium_polyedra.AAC.1
MPVGVRLRGRFDAIGLLHVRVPQPFHQFGVHQFHALCRPIDSVDSIDSIDSFALIDNINATNWVG